MFERKLKAVSVGDIQEAIHKALEPWTGEGSEVTIARLDFESGSSSYLNDTTRIELSIRKTVDWNFGATEEKAKECPLP